MVRQVKPRPPLPRVIARHPWDQPRLQHLQRLRRLVRPQQLQVIVHIVDRVRLRLLILIPAALVDQQARNVQRSQRLVQSPRRHQPRAIPRLLVVGGQGGIVVTADHHLLPPRPAPVHRPVVSVRRASQRHRSRPIQRRLHRQRIDAALHDVHPPRLLHPLPVAAPQHPILLPLAVRLAARRLRVKVPRIHRHHLSADPIQHDERRPRPPVAILTFRVLRARVRVQAQRPRLHRPLNHRARQPPNALQELQQICPPRVRTRRLQRPMGNVLHQAWALPRPLLPRRRRLQHIDTKQPPQLPHRVQEVQPPGLHHQIDSRPTQPRTEIRPTCAMLRIAQHLR